MVAKKTIKKTTTKKKSKGFLGTINNMTQNVAKKVNKMGRLE